MSKYTHIRVSSSILATILAALMLLVPSTGIAQEKAGPYDPKSEAAFNRVRGLNILGQLKEVLKAEYYDPKFRGIDLEKRFKEAEDRIKTQDKNWQIYRTIASVIAELKDSHTVFYPPDRLFRVEYGFTTMMIGPKCYIVDVNKGSDADAKAIKPGDEVLSISGVVPARETYNDINYIIYGLDPQEPSFSILQERTASNARLKLSRNSFRQSSVKRSERSESTTNRLNHTRVMS